MVEHDHVSAGTTSRREFLGRTAALTAGVVAGSALLRAGVADASGGVGLSGGWTNSAGQVSYSAALHLHGSFSELTGSWAGHFQQARVTGVDIVAPTEHDWRVAFLGIRSTYHFQALSETASDGTWRLQVQDSGPTSADSGAVISTDASPNDPVPQQEKGSLAMTARSTGSGTAKVVARLDTDNQAYSGSIVGRQLSLDVLCARSTQSGYLGLQLILSVDPVYRKKILTYRVRTDITETAYSVTGSRGFVDVPVPAGSWATITPDLAGDIARLWPATFNLDNALYDLSLVAVSRSAAGVSGSFGYLHFDYDQPGQQLTAYQHVVDHYRQSSGLLVPYGMEHSVDFHATQHFGEPFFFDYPPGTSGNSNFPDSVAQQQVQAIQQHGGIATYAHPFGTHTKEPAPSQYDAVLAAVKAKVLRRNVFSADAIEIGYDHRDMDLAGHLSLYWCLAANGFFVTATGVSDDHTGIGWAKQANRFLTFLWCDSLDEPSLRSAMRTGRVACGRLGDYGGALDLRLDGIAPMGSVLVEDGGSAHSLQIEAYGLPDGSTLQVVQGAVDHAGTSSPDPSLVATLSAQDLSGGGTAAVPVAPSGPCYLMVLVRRRDQTVIAFSNPVWLLPQPPGPGQPPIPGNRLVLAG